MEKKTRHKPLRTLMADASAVLTALCPCWMASPLSVSQLLDAGKVYFDYVRVLNSCNSRAIPRST
jgi:hypothetical protein